MIAPGELAAMQAIASRRWRDAGPYVLQHVGDLAWGASGPGADARRALVLDDAYAFVDGDEWMVGGDRLDAVLDAARDAGAAVYTLASDDAPAAYGYEGPTDVMWHLVHELEELPPLRGTVTDMTSCDPDERVAVHRDAWAPSGLTREVYDAVRATPPYRPDLDVVVRDGDGVAAAYTLAWYDAGSASGELEPVGTSRAHRRRGYAATAGLAALHRLRDAGARTAVVYADTDPANPGPRALYESLGFRAVDRHVRWSPPFRQNAAQGGTT